MNDPILHKVLDLLVVSTRASIHEHPIRLCLQLVVIRRIEHPDDLRDTIALNHRIDLILTRIHICYQFGTPCDDVGNCPQRLFEDGHGLLLEEIAQVLDDSAVHCILINTPCPMSHFRVVEIFLVIAFQRDHATDNMECLRDNVDHVMSEKRDDVRHHARGDQIL